MIGNKKYLFKKLIIYYLYTSLSINNFFYYENSTTYKNNIVTYFNDLFNISDYNYKLPKLGTYIPQGLSLVNDNIYVTAYDGKKEKNSVIFEITPDNNYRTIILDTKAHVGGITFDKNNNLFWICDLDGTISSYSYKDVITKDNVWAKAKKINVNNNDLTNHKGHSSVAYITVYNNCLFTGNYSTDNKGILKCFTITNEGNIDLSSVKTYKTPNKIQGVNFYTDNNNTYILFSKSYGSTQDSTLSIDVFDENKLDYRNTEFISYRMPRMMEEIIIDDNGNFMALFESYAYKYRNGIKDMDKIYSTKIKRLIKKD